MVLPSSLDVNVGVGQGSALSPILSALYLLSFLYILEKCLKILKIPISILLFINDSLLLLQNKLFSIFNFYLFCSYNIVINLLSKFRFIVEHLKTEVFHFTRFQETFSIPLLSTFLLLKDPSFVPRNCESTLDLFLIRNWLFINTLIFIPTKRYL